MEDKTPIEEVHRLLPEIAETREKIRTLRDQLKDVLEQNDEYRQMEEETKELAAKRATARKLLLDDKDYQQLKDEVDDYRLKLKDLEEILSHYLISHYNDTKQTQITDNQGETRAVLISAKIGKTEAAATKSP